MREIKDIVTLVQEVEKIKKTLSPSGQIWWRGQNQFTWDLKPSIFRDEYKKYDEKSGAQRFI